MGDSGEYLYSIAALFSFLAYLLSNMLWLRILLVAAALVYIISGISLGITSMIGWNSAYLIINLYHVIQLLLDQSTINLPEATKAAYQKTFPNMSTREFRRLITTHPFIPFNDQRIIAQNETTNRLFVVLNGRVDIFDTGCLIASLHTGDLIGEMSFMGDCPASASAIAMGEVECAYWTHQDMKKLEQKKTKLYNKFISVIGRDLVRKLRQKK